MRPGAPDSAWTTPRALEWMIGLPPSHGWILILLCLDLAALGAVATGTTLWFGPPYLLVMCLAAWCLGWRSGMTIGLICTALTFAVNGVALYPNGGIHFLWNFATRVIAIAVVVAIVAGARRAYLREWWLARRDPLTDAFNRQAFFELAEGLARSGRWRILFYADLDGLKRINDEQGHAAGDSALRSYADVVRGGIRRDDLFARVGGDEFLIFMAINDPESGCKIAKRLHDRMNSIPHESGGVLRCSLGALLVAPGERGLDDLVRRADALMYRSKSGGGSLEIETADARASVATAGRSRTQPRGAPIGRALAAPPETILASLGSGDPAPQQHAPVIMVARLGGEPPLHDPRRRRRTDWAPRAG